MTPAQQLEAIYQIFTPSAPVESPHLFVGRAEQIEQIKQIVEEKGQHGVIYGARGAGKTSLANIIHDIFEQIITVKITCNHSDTYRTIWQKAVSKVTIIGKSRGIGFNKTEQEYFINLALPPVEQLDPMHIERIFYDFRGHLLFIFDEFDSVTDPQTRQQMADTIKALSDNLPNISILIIGIAENIIHLIGNHPSIERCIKQIHIPLMSHEESEEFIRNSLDIIKLEIEQQVLDNIIEYATGFPHYLHLLCKYASIEAVNNGAQAISFDDLDRAVNLSIENSNASLRSAYEAAVSSSRQKNQFEDVILACSMLYDNVFSSNDVVEKFNYLTKREAKKEAINYNLGMLCKHERGQILEKIGKSGNSKFKFANPLMKAYVKLKMHEKIKY